MTTLLRVARPRGELPERTTQRLAHLAQKRDAAAAEYRAAVVDALAEGASFSEVSKATGLSTATLQKWKREA